MDHTPPPPRDPAGPPAAGLSRDPILPPDAEGMPLAEAGYVPPDPDEPPPLDLATAVGHTPPFATVALLLAWGVVFALMAFRGEHGDRLAYLAWGASATGRDALDSAWRLLASTFVHAGAAHVAANAVSMLLVGPGVERVLGRGAFLSVAALGGAAASLASLVWRTLRHPDVASVSVGASGVVFALGGAFLVGAYRLRGRLAPTRARAMGAALLFLLGQSLAAGFSRHGTDNVAHAVGLVAGALAAVAFPLAPRLGGAPQGTVRRVAGVLAGAALAVALGLAIRGGLAR